MCHSGERRCFVTVLKGKHVLLRALEREDLKLLHKWQNDAELMRLARSYPDHMISKEAIQAEYEKDVKGEQTDRWILIIEERSTGKAIGWASIRRWGRKAPGGDIGLAISEQNLWRKGYGTEVTQLLLREAFEELNLHRVEWWTNADNVGSLKLARKMLFREEGRLRDAVFFDNRFHDMVILGLLKPEYESKGKHS